MTSSPNQSDPPPRPAPPGHRPEDDGDKTIILNAKELLAHQEQMSRQQRRLGSLLVIDGTPADLGHHAAVDAEVVIGRDAAGLSLRDRKCSRRHAAVTRRGDLFVVRDLGSTNGTLLNGVNLAGEQPLRDGDRIVIGQTVIKFTIADDAEVGYLRQVEQLMLTDDLTGLMAKHRFDAALAGAIEVATVLRQPLCAFMMDMDGLKAINDRHGHQVGAFTIGRVGVLIGKVVAGRGEACRFGGDEFSAFIPRAGLATALEIGERIRREVEAAEVVYGPVTVKARISIGVAERPADVTDVDRLLALADQALYRAKAKGRNTVSD